MLRDITFGQYYPTDSVIHRLDSRVKLTATCLFIISILTFRSLWGYVVSFLFLASVIYVSKVPLKHILKGLKPIIIFIVFAAVFPLFSYDGTVIFQVWKLAITLEGVKMAVFRVLRLIFLMTGSSIMTYTTTPKQLTDGIEKSLGFLSKIKVPVHEVALIMCLALRFIPILMEEADRIIKAQSSRGVDFEEGNMFVRMKKMVSILIPLLVSAIRRANDLAYAMDARCYHGGAGRTKMKPLKYTLKDYLAYIVIITYFIISFIIGRYMFL